MLRVCVLLVSVCVLGVGSISGRGFFCRDPDTGKLHSVNSTWPASSFCGNFHCRVRRKNITGTEYAPRREINITEVNLSSDHQIKKHLKNETVFFSREKYTPVLINKENKNNNNRINDLLLLKKLNEIRAEENNNVNNETENDRYLTDIEIETLTKILHTVKKSDLDAIVEIYNLAQDIYKDIDKPIIVQPMDTALYSGSTSNNYKSGDFLGKDKNGRVSYWYEPLSTSKIRSADMSRVEMLRNEITPIVPVIPADMEQQGSQILRVVQKPYITLTPQPIVPPAPFSTLRKITDTYFNGPFSQKDFGKLPYYYPMSSFQRLSSYIHKQNKNKMTSPKAATASTAGNIRYQKEIKPSVLLPYPFYNIPHYNWTHPQNIYNTHKNRAVDKYDLRMRNDNIANAANAYDLNGVPTKTNAVLMNPDLENFQDLHVKPIVKEEKRSVTNLLEKITEQKPDWQTDPLPKHVLDDVSAHIQDKHGIFIHPFPLRKKVKLERIGRLIKMDELIRNKRSTDNAEEPLEPELYEVYIERTTCNADYSIPGYFRYGNLTQPFPECCPQRIQSR